MSPLAGMAEACLGWLSCGCQRRRVQRGCLAPARAAALPCFCACCGRLQCAPQPVRAAVPGLLSCADDEGDVEGPHLLISAIEQTEAEEAGGVAAEAADQKLA